MTKTREAWKRVDELADAKTKIGAVVGSAFQESRPPAQVSRNCSTSRSPRGTIKGEPHDTTAKNNRGKSSSRGRSKDRKRKKKRQRSKEPAKNETASASSTRKVTRPSFADVRYALQRVQGDGSSKKRARLLSDKGLPLDIPFETLCVDDLKHGRCGHNQCKFIHWRRSEVSGWCAVEVLLGWRQALALHNLGMESVDDVACYFHTQEGAEANDLGSIWLRAREGTRARGAHKARQAVESFLAAKAHRMQVQAAGRHAANVRQLKAGTPSATK